MFASAVVPAEVADLLLLPHAASKAAALTDPAPAKRPRREMIARRTSRASGESESLLIIKCPLREVRRWLQLSAFFVVWLGAEWRSISSESLWQIFGDGDQFWRFWEINFW